MRRALALPFVVAALLLLPLALWSRWDTRIAADLVVRELSFDLHDARLLLDARVYERVHVATRAVGEWQGRRFAISPEGSLTIERPRLDDLRIPRGARVTIARPDASTVNLAVQGARASARFLVPRGVPVLCELCEGNVARQIDDEDAVLTLQSESLRMAIENADGSIVAEGIAVGNPAFVTGTAERPASGVVAESKVRLRDIPGAEIVLLRGDDLEFIEPHDFTIQTIAAQPDGFRILMTGWAREVRTGGRNRLPSLLSRLHTNHALVLYFTAVVFLAGTAVTIMRELKLVEDSK